MTHNFIEYPANRAHHLSNINCVYCGRLFDDSIQPTKEHVIGRKFVPKGTLNGQWNLIVNACSECNNQKADLENDISAITMQPDVAGQHVNDDDYLVDEAKRKSERAVSRKTRKPVKDSGSSLNLHSEAPGFKMTFGFIAPPQIDFERVAQLACCHVTAFFFMQTYNAESCRGGFLLGDFHPLMDADKADWGNDVMKWFMQETQNWDSRLHAITAQEYFKISFRKSNSGVTAWAVEWNQKRRCIGFWGQKQDIDSIVKNKPLLKREHISGDTQNGLFIRSEKALAPEEDILFSNPKDIAA